MIILAFDTETTGLMYNHTIKSDKQPFVIEFYGCTVNLMTGEQLSELHTLVKPPMLLPDKPPFGEKKTPTQITGITNEMLADAPQFHKAADRIFKFIQDAPLVAAHNLAFDKEILDVEAERINFRIAWPPGICTVEQTIHLKGRRLALKELHEHLFDEKMAEAHRAKADVQSLVRCLIKMYEQDMI